MNTSALKSFAPAVRKQLIEAVTRKLDQALTARTPDYLDTFAPQVRALRELAAEDRKGLIERVAYTWFNRFTALRYLDAKGWHPFHARVLTAAGPEETLPELLKFMRDGALPDELRTYTDVTRLEALLKGRIPSTDPQAEVYRHLVLAACRFYHGLLPDVFERLDDETELLLPDDLLTAQSVAEGFRTEITDADCEQVEVLGWLYQFYISEKKDEVMKRKAAVPAEDIPAVTQLFTPHWIVRYLVENSLGRLWLLNRPESLLKAWVPYYIESPEPETEFLRIERPQDIRLCDPAVGSGHMLTYAFDLLYVIYEEEGYAPSEIPALILRHNLTGIEIDARAAQLAALALTLKAREKSPRFFHQQHFVRPNIVELRDIHFAEGELQGYSEALGLGGLFTPPILRLMHQFEEAKNFGSLIQPCVGESDIAFARGSVEARDLGSDLFLNETHKKVVRVLEQAEALTQRYHAVVANPPYMGQKGMNPSLKEFVDESFHGGRADLYSAFILRNAGLIRSFGLVGMITIPNWLFLESFLDLRVSLNDRGVVRTLIHNGRGLWGSDFGSCAFVFQLPKQNVLSYFKRLFIQAGEVNDPNEIQRRFMDDVSFPWILADCDSFRVIPGMPFAYWLSKALLNSFSEGRPLSDYADARQGLATAENARFLRLWYEPSRTRIDFSCPDRSAAMRSGSRWFPYNKGGSFRKWFGNSEFVVDWEDDGRALLAFRPRSVIRSPDKYFLPSITWSKVTISAVSFRLVDAGHLFDVAGCSLFVTGKLSRSLLAGFLNSPVTRNVLSVLSPTMNYEVGHIAKLPMMEQRIWDTRGLCENLVEEATAIARADWNTQETSWDFEVQPLLSRQFKGDSLSLSWQNWFLHTTSTVKRMREIEVENNAFWIRAYGLESDLSAEVAEEQITLLRADARRDVVALLSYAIGCIMGRYSLDTPGLILADAGDGVAEYLTKVGRPPSTLTLVPDQDGIVPIFDDEWFDDDIVARTRDFLKATFSEAMLRENIRFIEESLGRDLRTYFLTDFYKDHLQTYKKRPIYWMVQSPRKGFSVLIYLHRYTRDTMNVILNRYLREFQVKLRSKIDHLQQVGAIASASNREKTLAAKELTKLTKTLRECEEWERQTILPLAQARIELDLDDGVKVNYLKLREALAPIPGLAAAEEE
jgi:hypothetical protein